MTIIDPRAISELPVRSVVRNRPGDNYAWWHCMVHTMPLACSVSQDALNEISRRNQGADVDVVADSECVEVIAWLRRRTSKETGAYDVRAKDPTREARRSELESRGPKSIIGLARQWYSHGAEAELAAAVLEYEDLIKERT